MICNTSTRSTLYSVLILIILKLNFVHSKLCYFYPKDSSSAFQEFTTICNDDCCFLKAETESDACCSGFSSSSFWYIPIFCIFGLSLLLTFVLLTYVFICKRKKIRNENRIGGAHHRRNVEEPTAPVPENIYQTLGHHVNSIKPSSSLSIIQEMDVTRLPSYSEATKMKTEAPPDYRQLFSSKIILR